MKKQVWHNVVHLSLTRWCSSSAEINADGIGRDASTLVNKIKAAQYVRQHPGEVAQQNGKKVLNHYNQD